MKRLTLNPDPHLAYIYDPRDWRYNLPETEDLRERRAAALRACPDWMKDAARIEECFA